jgi:hypothetical protein
VITRIDLEYSSLPNHYYTDLQKVRGVINAWAEGYSMVPPHSPHPDQDPNRPRPDHERIQSRNDKEVSGGWRLGLLSNWVQIGLNIDGTLIFVDYTYNYLATHYYDTSSPAMEEIINHVQLAIQMMPHAAVWSPEAWTMFPLTSAPGDLKLPF